MTVPTFACTYSIVPAEIVWRIFYSNVQKNYKYKK